jgi:hypothetical protein
MDTKRFAEIQEKYAKGFEAASTPGEKQEVRDEYERDVNEWVHGTRLTTEEMMERRTRI